MSVTLPPRCRLRTAAILVASLAAVVLAGCGATVPDGAADAADEPGTRTSDHLLGVASLPRGWRESSSPGLDFRTTVCGVDLEPDPPVRAASIRFSKGPVGPFLEQHVRVHDPDGPVGPARLVEQLRTALATCTGYEARGTADDSPTARFEVAPLTVTGAPDRSVAWRQTSVGDLPITSDVLLVARDDTTVALMSYAVRDTPDPSVLERAVAGLPDGS